MAHLHLNLLVILVCGIVLWLIGSIWYSPALFSKPWMALVGVPPAVARKKMPMGLIFSFVGNMLEAFVLAHMIAWSGARTFAAGALVAFIVWVGFFAAPMIAQGVFEARPFKLFLINSGYWLLGLLIIGGVLAVWR